MATAYATITTLIRRYSRSQIAQVLNIDDSAVNSSTSLQEALDYGNDLVDGIVRSRYDLPLSEIPQRFRYMAGYAAWVNICQDYEKLSEDQLTNYNTAYDKFVEEVRNGVYDSQLRSLAEKNSDAQPLSTSFRAPTNTTGLQQQPMFRPSGSWGL